MLKSGLIIGGVTLLLATLFGLLFPLCVPCLALALGAGAGYLAGQFERPSETGRGAGVGAGAGALAGVGALIGHVVGGLINAVITGPEGSARLLEQLGIDVGNTGSNPVAYYGGALVVACCFGLLDVALMAGLGALGGLLWYQMTGRNQAGGMPAAPGM
jgi:hypothetical protein